MWYALLAILLASSPLALGHRPAQVPYNSAGKYVGPGVPVGVPIQGDYSGKWRPQVHFSPPKGFLNDPNGLFRSDNGTWHLYYQLNPTGLTSDFQHWGHATSDDLYHWINQPIAIYPTDNHTYAWSGCAVVDTNNTSGFFPDQTDGVIAMCSLHNEVKEVQAIAYSRDGGYTFTPYEGNPVLDINSDSFHDVGVTRYRDKWILTVSYVRAFTIGIFVSDNMIDWTPTSNITYVGVLGSNGYQCPNLKEMPIKNGNGTQWILSMAVNPGAPSGGSLDFFIPGDFNGTHFELVDRVTRFMDFAEDNYASQFFSNTPVDETYSIAWASNWAYTNDVPTDREGWRGAMSLPRRNQLTKVDPWGWELASAPVDLTPVLGQKLKSGSIMNSSWDIDFSSVTSGAVYLDINISVPHSASFYPPNAWLNFSLSNDNGEELVGRYAFSGSNTVYLDRTKTYGYDHPAFVNKWSTTQFKPAYRLQVVFDRSILEVFLDDGDVSGTMLAFPENPLCRLKINNCAMPEGSTMEAAVWGLTSVWS